MALLSDAGVELLLRWLHFLAGITWIGLLYYFNFVQGPFFAEADGATKSAATQKLVPRALWWFLWGAMFTFLSGAAIITKRVLQAPPGTSVMTSPWGEAIFTGALFGTLMFVNVWAVIWPKQQITAQTFTNISVRSEEHTSELQSPCNLVCRLLLEKKKKKLIQLPPAIARRK